MLTKEFLKYKKRNGLWSPIFIEPEAPNFVELADSLLNIYQTSLKNGNRRGEIAEELEPFIRANRDQQLAQAFDKLIQDNAVFDAVKNLDYPVLRQALLKRSSELIAQNSDFDTYRKELSKDETFLALNGTDLYGDLPENEQLTKLKPLTPLDITYRYNVAQVQGLLIYAHNLKIDLKAPEPSELRRLFKYLKFFRLLAEIKRKKSDIYLEISGPYELFANTRKYAIQLASFFPALLLLKEWKLEFEVELNSHKGVVKLNNDPKLRSHYRNFSSYIPEEIGMFHRHFKSTVEDWQIVGETPLIDIGGGKVAFPDLSFQEMGIHKKNIIHLELFHRWHKTELLQRLELLSKKPKLRLIIGLDRALANDEEYEQLTIKYPTLEGKIFRFRDFPGVDRVRRILEKVEFT